MKAKSKAMRGIGFGVIGMLLFVTGAYGSPVGLDRILTYHSFDKGIQADLGTVTTTVSGNRVNINNDIYRFGGGALHNDGSSAWSLNWESDAQALTAGSQFTIMFWAYRTHDNLEDPNEDEEYFYASDNAHNMMRLQHRWSGKDAIVVRGRGDADGQTNNVEVVNWDASYVFDDNLETWVHLGTVYDLVNNEFKLYVDGESVWTADISDWNDVNFDAFGLGRGAGTGVPAFAGLIDDFAFIEGLVTPDEWSRIADGESVTSVIPEPGTMGLLGAAFAGLLALRRRRS